MKLIIDVPSKEFGLDIKDNFQDFFERVKVEIAHRLNSDETLLCGNYELEIADMFLDAFKDMQIIPNTNGEVMMAMYPNLDVEIEGNCVTCWIDEHRFLALTLDWWNAPYKKQ